MDWSNEGSPIVSSAESSETATLQPLLETLQAELCKIAYAEHAAPLMPLKSRDLDALVDLFQQDGIEAIEADILRNLLWRHPEPHWDDPLSDFFNL